jgi:hypothetical protein
MFTINGETWYIELCHPMHPKLERSDGSLSIGACDDKDKTIYLNHNLQGNFLRKVLCHEITHAAMFSYDVDLTLEQEELLADLIATYGKEIIEITNTVFKKLREKPIY